MSNWALLGGLAGALLTVAVQSSSAVTVATIGFVNAGLLTLGQALWVLFGANVGTTMTGWLVALVGMKFEIETMHSVSRVAMQVCTGRWQTHTSIAAFSYWRVTMNGCFASLHPSCGTQPLSA